MAWQHFTRVFFCEIRIRLPHQSRPLLLFTHLFHRSQPSSSLIFFFLRALSSQVVHHFPSLCLFSPELAQLLITMADDVSISHCLSSTYNRPINHPALEIAIYVHSARQGTMASNRLTANSSCAERQPRTIFSIAFPVKQDSQSLLYAKQNLWTIATDFRACRQTTISLPVVLMPP